MQRPLAQLEGFLLSKSVFTNEYDDFIALLIDARKSAGLSQQGLADKLGKPQSFVSKYERGERRLDVIEFIHIARALGTRASTLLDRIEGGSANDELPR